MGRRKSDKFIPNGDSDFAWMARNFAQSIARSPNGSCCRRVMPSKSAAR
jgi:hypothetical protein